MVTVELIHIPEDRNKELGKFEWAQLTYSDLRVGTPDGGEDTVAQFDKEEGMWRCNEGKLWTDVGICA